MQLCIFPSCSHSLSAQPQSHTNNLTFLPFLPFPCWAVCHGREVRHHVILQWCVECIQPRVPRRWMTTNQTSVTGFQQHEKYIEPSARLEMACYYVHNFTAVLRPLHWMSHSFCYSWMLTVKPLYYLSVSSILFYLFGRTCSSRSCWSQELWTMMKAIQTQTQLPLMVWKTVVLMKISPNQREVTEYQAVWSGRLNAEQVEIPLFTLKRCDAFSLLKSELFKLSSFWTVFCLFTELERMFLKSQWLCCHFFSTVLIDRKICNVFKI